MFFSVQCFEVVVVPDLAFFYESTSGISACDPLGALLGLLRLLAQVLVVSPQDADRQHRSRSPQGIGKR